MKYYLISFFAICTLFSCKINDSNEINIYSQRHYEVDRIQYENFEKITGIKVKNKD